MAPLTGPPRLQSLLPLQHPSTHPGWAGEAQPCGKWEQHEGGPLYRKPYPAMGPKIPLLGVEPGRMVY